MRTEYFPPSTVSGWTRSAAQAERGNLSRSAANTIRSAGVHLSLTDLPGSVPPVIAPASCTACQVC